MFAGRRFGCPSASLELKALLKRRRSTVWIGVALAVGTHMALTQLQGRAEQQTAARPLTTRFVKRQPRLTNPLELKKLPRPKPRWLHLAGDSVALLAGR